LSIVEIKTESLFAQPITSIVDCQLPIADLPGSQSTIGKRQSAIGLTPFSSASYSAEKVGVVRIHTSGALIDLG
jgi:hypothetical protein